MSTTDGGESSSAASASSSSSSSVETLPERTSNYFATYDETELFDALREQHGGCFGVTRPAL